MMVGPDQRMVCRCREGMTLIELLIASALVAVAALVVAQAFSAGMRVWYRARQLEGNYSDSLIALESLQQDFRNTIPCRQTAFRGGATWMEIPALIGLEGKMNEDQLGVIRYEFDVGRQTLERVLTPCEVVATGAPRRESLADGVTAGRFIYADRGGTPGGALVWGGTWEGRTNNPAGVKVMWVGQQGKETFEIERTVSMPSG